MKAKIEFLKTIISTPSAEFETSGGETNYQFGYYESRHHRPQQEDSLVWHVFTKELCTNLTPDEIAHRKWTSYKLLDRRFSYENSRAGTTASTIFYDGQHIITSTIADSVAYGVFYDKHGAVLRVIRLNTKTHSVEDESEYRRIKELGTDIVNERIFCSINGKPKTLGVSRSIGDQLWKDAGVCPDAAITITTIKELLDIFKIDKDNVGSFQVIIACDGFTESAWEQTLSGHEHILYSFLTSNIVQPGKLQEQVLAKLLVAAAKPGSRDNISVAVQRITESTPPFLMGVYDGHGGHEASHYVANYIGTTIMEQCSLPHEHYVRQEFSVPNNLELFQRDNANLFCLSDRITPKKEKTKGATSTISDEFSLFLTSEKKIPSENQNAESFWSSCSREEQDTLFTEFKNSRFAAPISFNDAIYREYLKCYSPESPLYYTKQTPSSSSSVPAYPGFFASSHSSINQPNPNRTYNELNNEEKRQLRILAQMHSYKLGYYISSEDVWNFYDESSKIRVLGLGSLVNESSQCSL